MNPITENRPPFASIGDENIRDFFGDVQTPCYVIDEIQLRKNGEILKQVSKQSGGKILLAQKAFSNFNLYPTIRDYVYGTEASGLYEARLGYEEMSGKEVHVFCGAYRDDEFVELMNYADHIVFNSVGQLKKFGLQSKNHQKSIGLRINPECSTQEGHAIYDPCASGSRLGVTRRQWDEEMDSKTLELLDGLHFHTLCEQNADDFFKTWDVFEDKFSDILPRISWVNVGGGHHITRFDYRLKEFSEKIAFIRKKWNVDVYIEPGEAVALNAGFLVSRVLDIVRNGEYKIAILDTSAACHMPDVIEMPYVPPLYGASQQLSNDCSFRYRLAGPTCLAGDVIGDYHFPNELKIGDVLVFGDMAIYTTCKNNTFNGMPLPNIYQRKADGELIQITDFGYKDFKMRLGRKIVD